MKWIYSKCKVYGDYLLRFFKDYELIVSNRSKKNKEETEKIISDNNFLNSLNKSLNKINKIFLYFFEVCQKIGVIFK